MAVMIGPAANFCLLGCLFVVVVVVVNTGTVRRKTFTHSLPSVYVCWSVCIGIPTLTLHPLSLFLSLTHHKQTNKHTYKLTNIGVLLFAHPCLCVPQFMRAKKQVPLSIRARNKYMYTAVYACRKKVHVYHCLCVQKTSTSVPQQLRESPSPSNCWTRAQR